MIKTVLKRLFILSAVGLLSLAGWLWLTMLSPWFYDRPDELPAIEQRIHHVFVYGTLRFAPVRLVVMGSLGEPEEAVLEGYQRNGLDLSPQPNSRVEGLRLRVDADELARLDRYERLGIRYERVEKALSDGTTAWVYVRLPKAESAFFPYTELPIALVP
ncbi:gamma-glutamylcyclotransferase family protein [Halovibrio sp. HP20-50]|uniref:gamma-glutamylcyclotransferase family protein n=1 Tax=Halovibrio sp. HP20-59 TaxID=3080275 RepID=UPI00294B1828|nr:gamma-glutamylcyclotransferase family protein [Halovibrio sp. HP20-59]MEA2117499.1 gamma-glutamylcyclotransferase family protein [Halovibrio sp. HP20-59]